MDFLDGKRLVDGIFEQIRILAPCLGMTEQELYDKYTKDVKAKDIAEVKRDNQSLKKYLKLRDLTTSWNLPKYAYNLTPLRLITGPLELKWTPEPINLAEILELLLHVHAYEIFQDGAFNGDPHPGRCLLYPPLVGVDTHVRLQGI